MNIKKVLIKFLIDNTLKHKIQYKNSNTLSNNRILFYNNKWDYNNIVFNYSNNTLLNKQKYKFIIYKYINYMFNHKINNKIVNILYKKPIIIYNNNNVKNNDNNTINNVILFIYKPNRIKKLSKYSNIINSEILINKLIQNLINHNILNIFNIKPIILNYEYLDSEIYSKSLGKYILKNVKFDKVSKLDVNKNILRNIISKKIENNKIKNKINELLYLINKYNKQWSYNSWYNKSNEISNNLLYKNIIGYNWQFKGKRQNSESNSRSIKYMINKGKFQKIDNLNNKLILNSYSNNLSKNKSFIINKNGLYSINVTLSHY